MLGLLNTDDDPNTALQNMPKVANWEGKLFTRRDLNALCQINLGTTVQEFQKRYKACNYPPYHSLFLQVGKNTKLRRIEVQNMMKIKCPRQYFVHRRANDHCDRILAGPEFDYKFFCVVNERDV